MKPTAEQLLDASNELSAIPYYPTDPSARAAVARALSSFVSEERKLGWLVDAAVDHMEEWKGVAQLRALYCTRFKPADGVEGPDCQISGFRPDDSEAKSLPPARDRRSLELEDVAARKRLTGESGDRMLA